MLMKILLLGIKQYKCENKKDGEQSLKDRMADADTYYVNVVWK